MPDTSSIAAAYSLVYTYCGRVDDKTIATGAVDHQSMGQEDVSDEQRHPGESICGEISSRYGKLLEGVEPARASHVEEGDRYPYARPIDVCRISSLTHRQYPPVYAPVRTICTD